MGGVEGLFETVFYGDGLVCATRHLRASFVANIVLKKKGGSAETGMGRGCNFKPVYIERVYLFEYASKGVVQGGREGRAFIFRSYGFYGERFLKKRVLFIIVFVISEEFIFYEHPRPHLRAFHPFGWNRGPVT